MGQLVSKLCLIFQTDDGNAPQNRGKFHEGGVDVGMVIPEKGAAQIKELFQNVTNSPHFALDCDVDKELRYPSGHGIGSWQASYEFEPSTTKDPPSTRGLLATAHVILNHGQVTWTTPELAPSSPNYHTTPTGGRFSSRQI
ncbi:hypothetical protein TNCV_3984011 [Trichonephila clavipes]|nr:hypothetical protein TNCV_3984011 [Trichonephila clavipes]